MSLDLYRDELRQDANTRPVTTQVEPGLFEGFVRGTGMFAMKEFAKTARSVSMAGAAIPVAVDAITGGTTLQDKYFKSHEDTFGSAVKFWDPDPGTVGEAGQVAGALIGLLPQIIANPAAAVASTQLSAAEDLVTKPGVSANKAMAVGAAQALGLGVGIWAPPAIGNNLAQWVATGAGINWLQGVVTRGASSAILEGTEAAKEFPAFGLKEQALDILLGAAFGGAVKFNKGWRQEAMEAREAIEMAARRNFAPGTDPREAKLAPGAAAVREAMAAWGDQASPTQKAALATLRVAQHANVDSLPGRPTHPGAIDINRDRLSEAIDSLLKDKPLPPEGRTAAAPEPDRPVPEVPTLRDVSNIALQQAGDVPEITRGMVPPRDWEILTKLGVVQEGKTEDGNTYQYVDSNAVLGPERDRRAQVEADDRAQGVPIGEKIAGLENRIAAYERALEAARYSEPDKVGELETKLDMLNERLAKLKEERPDFEVDPAKTAQAVETTQAMRDGNAEMRDPTAPEQVEVLEPTQQRLEREIGQAIEGNTNYKPGEHAVAARLAADMVNRVAQTLGRVAGLDPDVVASRLRFERAGTPGGEALTQPRRTPADLIERYKPRVETSQYGGRVYANDYMELGNSQMVGSGKGIKGERRAFRIMDKETGAAADVGFVIVEIDKNGKFAALRNIEIRDDYRGNGAGERVVATMLAHNGPGYQMDIVDITHAGGDGIGSDTDALPFWKKVGTNLVNYSRDPNVQMDGMLSLEDYLGARRGRGTEAGDRGAAAADLPADRGGAGAAAGSMRRSGPSAEDRAELTSLLGEEKLFQTLPGRVPTAVGMTPSVDDIVVPDLAGLKLDQAQYDKAVDAVWNDPGMRETGVASKLRTTDARAEYLISRMVDNLLWLHDQMPIAIRQRAKLWYDGAQRIAEGWATRWGKSRAQAAGILAVLSPQKDWFMNTTMAERVGDILHGKMQHKWDESMTAAAFKFLVGDAGKADPEAAKNTTAFNAAKGKTLAEVVATGDKRQMGVWIRAYDEAHHAAAHAVITPEGGFAANKLTAAGEEARRAWGDFVAIGKAASIFVDGSPQNISANLGLEHKVRNFYNNIFNANDPRFTTIDTHAVAAAQLRPLAGADKAVADNFGATGGTNTTGISGTYPLYYEAYKRAAEARGLIPREMQSITWEGVRGLFTEGFKNADNKAAVDAIWKDHTKGKLTLEEARAKISEIAGGMNEPDWWQGEGKHESEVLQDKTYATPREPHRGAIINFEVAPDPRNAELTARWDALPLEVKARVSHDIAWSIAAKAMSTVFTTGTGKPVVLKGELHQQLGGWMDATNPSLSIWLDPNISAPKAIDLARVLGYALNQQGMMFSQPKKFKGGTPMGVVAIDIPAGGDVHAIYTKLREIPGDNGEPLIYGHTTVDGKMAILLEGGEARAAEVATLVHDKLQGEYNVGHGETHAAFPEKGSDDYGLAGENRSGEVGAEPSVRAAADQLRAEAAEKLNAAIERHEQSAAAGAGKDQGRLNQDSPWYYSALGRAIDNSPTKAADANGWKQWLKGLVNKGIVKADEIKATELEEYLDATQGKITKEQLQTFMQEGGVRVEEVMLGAPPGEPPEIAVKRQRFQDLVDIEEDPQSGRSLTPAERAEMDELQGELLQHPNPWLRRTEDQEPQFAQWQLPGFKPGSYREIALVLPELAQARAERLALKARNDAKIPMWREINAKWKPQIDEARAASMAARNQPVEVRDQLHAEVDRLLDARDNELEAAGVMLEKPIQQQVTQYKVPQGHSMGDKADTNRIAHIRFNERTGPNGERIMFWEEIQADKGQEWLKLKTKVDDGKATDAEKARFEFLDKFPFNKTEAWVALSLKRMIRYAAENGFDQIAWTTGAQQADRYDLSKHISRIEYEPINDPPGTYEVEAYGMDGKRVMHEDEVPLNRVEEMLGKEIAKKIADGEGEKRNYSPARNWHTLAGLDLKVGGEGMKGFYDKIVPTVAKDVMKKLGGGKVEQIELRNQREDFDPDALENATSEEQAQLEAGGVALKQQGLTITPEMRAKVMEGQALFQRPVSKKAEARGFLDIAADRKLTIGLLENSDPSTLIHEPAHAFLEIMNDLAKTTPELEGWMQIFFDDNGITRQQWDNWGINEKRVYHERFARGFESYVMSGKAPTEDLRTLFQKFRGWLIAIYKSATTLNVKVSKEMEGLYAKLLGSEQADPSTTAQAPRATDLESPPPPPSRVEEGAPAAGGLDEKAGQGDNAPDPLAMEADRVAAELGDQPMEITMPDGSTQTMTAAQYLTEIRDAAAMAREDIALINEAAQCLLGAV